MIAPANALQQNHNARRQYLALSFVLAIFAWTLQFTYQALPVDAWALAGQGIANETLVWALVAITLLVSMLALLAACVQSLRYYRYQQAQATLKQLLKSQDVKLINSKIAVMADQALTTPLIRTALASELPALEQHLTHLIRQNLQKQLVDETGIALQECDRRLVKIKGQMPLIKAETALREALTSLRQRRQDLALQWEQAYEQLSWWNKLNLTGTPDYSEMDSTIRQLERLHTQLLKKHADDFVSLNQHLNALKSRATKRIAATQQRLEQHIKTLRDPDQEMDIPLQAGLWLSALSIPVSIWDDATTAGNVYDTLRQVNGNYAYMSDSEIWWDTLFMPTEQWVGLASLTKGAYFEQLVAADTGGTLFEHFNNPGTDIVIDGIAFQIKATDSAAYINSVEPYTPIIATSEVAEITRAIDSGYSDAELERAIDLALGGSVIDVKDTATDALLAGIGGLGLFASLQGINHTAVKFNNGGNGVEAIFEGVGVAIEGTARALVGTAELGYKMLASRPSRFVGRTLLAGLKKLDDKMMEAGSKPK